jgi:hypothetical protein
MRRSMPLILLLALPLSGCPTTESTGVYYDANTDQDVETPAEVVTPEEVVPEGKKPMRFAEITIGPEVVTVEDDVVAHASLVEGVSSFAEVEYTWYVNDNDLSGVQRNTLDPRTGRYRKGDRIKVIASAIDERGQTASVESPEITIANGIPRILNTDADKRIGIDGLIMKAEDPDGDPISWSILEGPPGVEIEASGRIRVRHVDLDEAFEGEVVVAASDPTGARAEWHIPVAVNAAVEEVIGERVTTTERTRLDMTDEEYEKANLEALDRVMGMDDEAFERYTREQEDREQEYLRKKRKEGRR